MRKQNLKALIGPPKGSLAARNKSYRLTVDFVFPDAEITSEELKNCFFRAMGTNTMPPGRVTIVDCEPRPFVGHIIDAVSIETKMEADATTPVNDKPREEKSASSSSE